MSVTAADYFAVVIDAERLENSAVQYSEGRVSHVMEGLFHTDDGEKEEEDDDKVKYCCNICERSEHKW